MAQDRELVARLRDHLEGAPGVTEKAMSGGVAFLVDGHLAVAADGSGGLLVRVDPDRAAELAGSPHAEPFHRPGHEADGWVRVEVDGVGDAELRQWIEQGVGHARTLSPR